MGAAEKQNNRLPDGRQIRALEGTFNQKQMFTLHKSGLFVPANETIMSVKELDQSIQSGAHESVGVRGWWRSGDYAFYLRGVDQRKDIPLGEKLLYIEEGFSHVLNIPDVEVTLPNGEIIGLRQAVGMGIIKIEKLELRQIDETMDEVSVTTDFDPKTDVKVVDVMRPRAWALVDADGYPLRTKPSEKNNSEARYSFVRSSDDFADEATGWHGSAGRGVDGNGRYIAACFEWQVGSGVAVVGRATPKIKLAKAPEDPGVLIHGASLEDIRALTEASNAEVDTLLRTVRPEALEATRKLLQALEIKE